MRITRNLLISGPYKDCPRCNKKDSFGVFAPVSGHSNYIRECLICSYQKKLPLPQIKKKVIYLDQFILSNLTKLLDTSHPKHSEIKKDSFWKILFEKLEHVSNAQAVVFPDSFFHKDESTVGRVQFNHIRRLYEHLSSGKTLLPSYVIERKQITLHFENWLNNQKTIFNFQPEDISFERDGLHKWSIGMSVSVNFTPNENEVSKLIEQNSRSREQLKKIWEEWKKVQNFNFLLSVRNEASALRFHINNVVNFYDRQNEMIIKASNGEYATWEESDMFPPPSKYLLDELLRICMKNNLLEHDAIKIIYQYFHDADSLLEIPKIKISSIMYANLSRRASLGKKNPPKSFADIEFISSYLPYCDAMFIDIESKNLLTELPRNTPQSLRLDCFTKNIYTKRNRDEFLSFLDSIINEIPNDQIKILEDISGKDYYIPYWKLIEDEKKDN